jgi:hypothetical protein
MLYIENCQIESFLSDGLLFAWPWPSDNCASYVCIAQEEVQLRSSWRTPRLLVTHPCLTFLLSAENIDPILMELVVENSLICGVRNPLAQARTVTKGCDLRILNGFWNSLKKQINAKISSRGH